MINFDLVGLLLIVFVLGALISTEYVWVKVTLAWQYVVALVRHFPRKTQKLKQDIAHLSGLLECAHGDNDTLRLLVDQLRASLALASVEYRTLQNASSSLLNAARQESYELAREVEKLENEKYCAQMETDRANDRQKLKPKRKANASLYKALRKS